MRKISQQTFSLPLPIKSLKIMGLRVETSQSPLVEVMDAKLSVKDNWKIQLAYTPLREKDYLVTPSLLEFPVTWQDTFPWSQGEKLITASYVKKPLSIASTIIDDKKGTVTMSLTLEVIFSLTIPVVPVNPPLQELPAAPLAKEKVVVEEQSPEVPIPNLAEKYCTLAAQLQELQTRFTSLETRFASLETVLHEHSQFLTSKQGQEEIANIRGLVYDSFRLTPISKAIIELSLTEEEEPLYKLATDERGYYHLANLKEGSYLVKIKHPRYLTLTLKNFQVKAKEDKMQDFMLRRI